MSPVDDVPSKVTTWPTAGFSGEKVKRASSVSPVELTRTVRLPTAEPQALFDAVTTLVPGVAQEIETWLLPDELMGDSSLLAQMCDVCVSTGGSSVGVLQVPIEEVSAYGVPKPAGPIDEHGVIPVAGTSVVWQEGGRPVSSSPGYPLSRPTPPEE